MRSEKRPESILCEFQLIKSSHNYSCPTGVQAEAEHCSGTVRLHGNTTGVQQGGPVGVSGRDGAGGVDYCHHPPFWQTYCQRNTASVRIITNKRGFCFSLNLWCVPRSSPTGKVHSWTRLSSTFRDSASTTDTSTLDTRPRNVSSCIGKEKEQTCIITAAM